MRTLVVTAANEGFAPLLRGLIGSLKQWEPRPFADIACFDLGLAPATRQSLARDVSQFVVPGWDMPAREKLQKKNPEVRGMTVRPFLPRYFPGYDIYLWIDADAWVQERFAIDWYVEAAAGGGLAVAPHADRSYRQTEELLEWRIECMRAYYGRKAAHRLLWETYYNTGVFALRADAPHWAAWAKRFESGLKANGGRFVYDQNPLNYAIWMDDLPVTPLPATCNWLCHLALPVFNVSTGRFCEPFLPGQPIGLLHLASKTKDMTLEIPHGRGTRKISLRFPATSLD